MQISLRTGKIPERDRLIPRPTRAQQDRQEAMHRYQLCKCLRKHSDSLHLKLAKPTQLKQDTQRCDRLNSQEI